MKRLVCMLLITCLLLSGCSIAGERIKEPVSFYYIRTDYQKNMDQVIASEVREASGHRNDLPYLLVLYSMGPSTEDLRSPLPRNTTISLTERSDSNIVLSLSEKASTITDVDFTVAATCIAMTCMELTGIPLVTVTCGDRNISIRGDSLLLQNRFVQNTQEESK